MAPPLCGIGYHELRVRLHLLRRARHAPPLCSPTHTAVRAPALALCCRRGWDARAAHPWHLALRCHAPAPVAARVRCGGVVASHLCVRVTRVRTSLATPDRVRAEASYPLRHSGPRKHQGESIASARAVGAEPRPRASHTSAHPHACPHSMRRSRSSRSASMRFAGQATRTTSKSSLKSGRSAATAGAAARHSVSFRSATGASHTRSAGSFTPGRNPTVERMRRASWKSVGSQGSSLCVTGDAGGGRGGCGSGGVPAC